MEAKRMADLAPGAKARINDYGNRVLMMGLRGVRGARGRLGVAFGVPGGMLKGVWGDKMDGLRATSFAAASFKRSAIFQLQALQWNSEKEQEDEVEGGGVLFCANLGRVAAFICDET
jgi:hypothetical protein